MADDSERTGPNDPQGGAFETTQWSMVLLAGDGDSPAALKALERLCRTYWPPLYAFARRDGLDGHTAQDAVQGFLAMLLARQDIARADPARGRFRAFLVGSFKHFLTSQVRADRTLKRGGGVPAIPIDVATADELIGPEMTDRLSPDKACDRRWARTVMSRALERLRAEHVTTAQARIFAALECVLADGARLADAEQLAAELGMSRGALSTAATRLRQRYRHLIEDEVERTLENPGDLADELRVLREAWL